MNYKEAFSRAVNCVLWGTENPSPTEKSIGRQFHKDEKLKNKINKIINKLKRK